MGEHIVHCWQGYLDWIQDTKGWDEYIEARYVRDEPDAVEHATGIRPTWAVFGESPARRIPPRNTPGTSSGEHTQGDL